MNLYWLNTRSLALQAMAEEYTQRFSAFIVRCMLKLLVSSTGLEPSDGDLQVFVKKYCSSEQVSECKMQRMRGVKGYQNFDMTAAWVVIKLGFAIIMLGLLIDSAVDWTQKRSHRGMYGRLQWILDGLFQQQRLVYESMV